jgi:predicted nucleic acid-binding protein
MVRWLHLTADAVHHGAMNILNGESHLWGGLLAATALEHGFTVATRNVKDFQHLGLAIVNPWESPIES